MLNKAATVDVLLLMYYIVTLARSETDEGVDMSTVTVGVSQANGM